MKKSRLKASRQNLTVLTRVRLAEHFLQVADFHPGVDCVVTGEACPSNSWMWHTSVPARKATTGPGISASWNVLLEAFLLTQTTAIPTENINIPIIYNNEFLENLSLKEAKKKVVTQFERDYIFNLLIQHQGNISHAAKEAQKDRSDFGKMIRKHHIDVRTFRNKEL